MTADEVRALYDEPPGTKVPRFALFTRECVGALVAEIDRLKAREAELTALTLQQASLITESESVIGGLLKEINLLKTRLSAAYDRVAAQSELPSKRAEATASVCSAHRTLQPGCPLCNVAFTGLGREGGESR